MFLWLGEAVKGRLSLSKTSLVQKVCKWHVHFKNPAESGHRRGLEQVLGLLDWAKQNYTLNKQWVSQMMKQLFVDDLLGRLIRQTVWAIWYLPFVPRLQLTHKNTLDSLRKQHITSELRHKIRLLDGTSLASVLPLTLHLLQQQANTIISMCTLEQSAKELLDQQSLRLKRKSQVLSVPVSADSLLDFGVISLWEDEWLAHNTTAAKALLLAMAPKSFKDSEASFLAEIEKKITEFDHSAAFDLNDRITGLNSAMLIEMDQRVSQELLKMSKDSVENENSMHFKWRNSLNKAFLKQAVSSVRDIADSCHKPNLKEKRRQKMLGDSQLQNEHIEAFLLALYEVEECGQTTMLQDFVDQIFRIGSIILHFDLLEGKGSTPSADTHQVQKRLLSVILQTLILTHLKCLLESVIPTSFLQAIDPKTYNFESQSVWEQGGLFYLAQLAKLVPAYNNTIN